MNLIQKFLFCLTCVFLSTPIIAQTVYNFGKFDAYANNSKVSAFHCTDMFDHVVAGTFHDSIDIDPGPGAFVLYGGSPSVSNAFVAIFNDFGNLSTGFALGNVTDSVKINDVMIYGGSVYVGGHFTGIVDFNHTVGAEIRDTSYIPELGFVARYDMSGNLIYMATFETSGSSSSVKRIHVDDCCGNVYVLGSFTGTLDANPSPLGTNILTCASGVDGYLIKLNVAFNYYGSGQYSGTGTRFPDEITTDISGNIFIGGEFNNTINIDLLGGSTVLTSSGGTDAFLARYDGGFNLLNYLKLGGTGNDDLKDVFYNPVTNYQISFLLDYENSVDLDPNGTGLVVTSNGLKDVAIAKYTTDMSTFIYGKSFGNSANNSSFSMNCVQNGLAHTSVGPNPNNDLTFTMNFSGSMDFDPSAANSILATSSNTPINTAIITLDSLGTYADHGLCEAKDIIGFGLGATSTNEIYMSGNFSGNNVDILPFQNSSLLTNAANTGYYIKFHRCHITAGNAHLVGLYECGTSTASMAIDTISNYRDPLSYWWYNGDYNTADVIATGASADVNPYIINVTDGNNCDYYDSVFIQPHTAGAELGASVFVNPTTCGNNFGSASVSSINAVGTPVYYWYNGDANTSVDSLVAGSYFVQISDDYLCYVNQIFTVDNSNGPIITIVSSTDAYCASVNSGSIDISISGGALPYTFLWSNGATTEDISGLAGGIYTVIVTDATGCTSTQCVTIIQSYPLDIFVNTSIPATACGVNDAMITVGASGGHTPYSFQWDSAAWFQTNDTASNLFAGMYSVTVTDSLGCTLTEQVVAVDAFGPWISYFNSSYPSCTGGVGFIEVDTWGSPPYTYQWNSGQNTEDIYNITKGQYVCVATDVFGCKGGFYTDIYQMVSNPPTICMVTVDSTGTQNVVVWDKSANPEADHFNIYREGFCNTTDFGYVGMTMYDSLSVFYDTVVNTNTRSWKYYVTTVDTCGFESWPSDIHRTIHLTTTIDANIDAYLQWEPYMGRPIQRYEIFREQPANNGIFDLVDTVSGMTFSYLDTTNFGSYTELEYYVDAIPSTICFATKAYNQNSGRTNHTRNVVPMDTTILNVEQVDQIMDDIRIYPNPANNRLMINVGANGINYKVTITNQFGQLVKSLATNHTVAISTIDLQQGIYFVRFESDDKQNKIFKVVIAR